MMKYLPAICAALAILAAPAAASSKSTIEGRWKNGTMEIKIARCGRDLCGTVVRASPRQAADAKRGSGTDLVGARLITGIQPTGPGTYSGRVFIADRNVHADGTMSQVSRNRLEVRGCVLAVLCRSETWDRVR
jgi:uncharacterized protein (DUF2147 family)